MVFPWFSHGFPIVFPWFSHGRSTFHNLFSHGRSSHPAPGPWPRPPPPVHRVRRGFHSQGTAGTTGRLTGMGEIWFLEMLIQWEISEGIFFGFNGIFLVKYQPTWDFMGISWGYTRGSNMIYSSGIYTV